MADTLNNVARNLTGNQQQEMTCQCPSFTEWATKYRRKCIKIINKLLVLI